VLSSSAATDQSGSGGTAEAPVVDLSEKQAGTLKIGPVGSREFAPSKTAVGTIDFNENMLVQVFSQYPGKILKAFYNIGDEVKAGDTLFTIDSPDLLQAESTLLAGAGVLELQKRTLARAVMLLKAGGSAQKDVDQSGSRQHRRRSPGPRRNSHQATERISNPVGRRVRRLAKCQTAASRRGAGSRCF
jgi:membrane fusion protein, heavy metal efflux system